jgi:hypothetical protein
MEFTKVIGLIAFAAMLFGGIVCWFVSVVDIFRAVASRKEGVPLFAGFGGPFSVLFRPQDLTERGLAARRWVAFGFIGFFVCALSGALVGVMTGVAH